MNIRERWISLLHRAATGTKKTRTLLTPIGVLVLLVWGAGYVSRRHTLALVLPWIGHAAVGWRWAAGRLASQAAVWGGGAGAERAPRWIALALVALLVVAWLPRDLRERRGDRAAVRAASSRTLMRRTTS